MEDTTQRFKNAFLNRRDWGTYVAALQSAATYPKVVQAVKSGQAWFSESAVQATSWLVGIKPLTR